MTEPTGAARPHLTIVRGEPSPEQVAALVAVLATRGAAAPAQPAAPSLWRSPLRAALPAAAPGAWRASGLPLR